MAQWSIVPVVDWLMHKGRHLPGPEQLVAELRARVQALGERWPSLGRFELPGVERPMDVVALP